MAIDLQDQVGGLGLAVSRVKAWARHSQAYDHPAHHLLLHPKADPDRGGGPGAQLAGLTTRPGHLCVGLVCMLY